MDNIEHEFTTRVVVTNDKVIIDDVEREHRGHKDIKYIKQVTLAAAICKLVDALDAFEGQLAMKFLDGKKPVEDKPTEKKTTSAPSKKTAKETAKKTPEITNKKGVKEDSEDAYDWKGFWGDLFKEGYSKDLVHALAKKGSITELGKEDIEGLKATLIENKGKYAEKLTGKIREAYIAAGSSKTLWKKTCTKILGGRQFSSATIGEMYEFLKAMKAGAKKEV